ncbi:protein-arginine kinase [Moorella sp. E308F]|jgi:protein arginine kinase|uniref:protein arginine kinase n=1 Tax=unclassified Neomoorella TaxID=2676739 RepID=UPI0010FFACBB|nr:MULTISPECIES: protein arginine kinase [unclassified Moorella (in: firmicutes)]GEA14633.1 protein-arginine kinase [Moorella sp. E308F]GEA17982.1 protein-arginine kinase [Moorella sp. E306M]
MSLNLERSSKWMEGSGPQADIVISSRIRLARNLKGMPFPNLMNEAQEVKVIRQVSQAIRAPGVFQAVGELKLQTLRELSPVERQILVEKHLISPDLAEGKGEKAVVLRDDEAISIMVNEEDHLRLQCLLPALMLHEAWRLADAADDALENELDFAFDQERGYLTACPTNVGTGLRASTMLHLPALVLTKQAGQVLTALTKVGVTVRGLYGEGTEAQGNIFQVSNQITLGRSEEEIINNLSAVTVRLADQEREARELLRKQNRWQLEDRVGRAYGVLTNARVLSSQEALQLLSDVRLGVEMKILRGIDQRLINQLMVRIQPAYLQFTAGKEMTPFERDVRRAAMVREFLAG